MTKIVCLICVYERHLMTQINIDLIMQQKLPVQLLLVVSNRKDEKFAQTNKKKYKDVDYIMSPNQPLGLKFQNGIEACRKYDPDAVIVNGSDDLLTLNWVETAYHWIKEGYHVVGKDSLWIYNVPTNEVYKSTYIQDVSPHTKGYRFFGAGRMISKWLLDVLNWKVYPRKIRSGLDYYSTLGFLNVTDRFKNIPDDDVNILSIKSKWDCITTMEVLLKSNKLIMEKLSIDDLKKVVDFDIDSLPLK